MVEWLSTFNETMGMYNAHMITTIFGAFFVTFAVCICWGKMIESFGPIGGMMCAAIIVGTFWVMNHKLPGWGIAPGMRHVGLTGDDPPMQYGLINQAFHYGGPWVDMGFAAGFGLWISSVYSGGKVAGSVPRLAAVLVGGLIGGAIVGLIGFSYGGAELPGWPIIEHGTQWYIGGAQ